jgi:hypothetical protein
VFLGFAAEIDHRMASVEKAINSGIIVPKCLFVCFVILVGRVNSTLQPICQPFLLCLFLAYTVILLFGLPGIAVMTAILPYAAIV